MLSMNETSQKIYNTIALPYADLMIAWCIKGIVEPVKVETR